MHSLYPNPQVRIQVGPKSRPTLKKYKSDNYSVSFVVIHSTCSRCYSMCKVFASNLCINRWSQSCSSVRKMSLELLNGKFQKVIIGCTSKTDYFWSQPSWRWLPQLISISKQNGYNSIHLINIEIKFNVTECSAWPFVKWTVVRYSDKWHIFVILLN